MQKTYELMLVVDTSGNSDIKAISKTIGEQLKDQGKIIAEKDFGKKRLSYPIDKKEEGNYYLFNVTMPPKHAKTVTEKLKLDSRILRHLLVSTKGE